MLRAWRGHKLEEGQSGGDATRARISSGYHDLASESKNGRSTDISHMHDARQVTKGVKGRMIDGTNCLRLPPRLDLPYLVVNRQL